MMRKNRKAMSLVEITVVIAIIGILATLGINQYQVFVEKSHGAEAKGTLNLIYRNYKIQQAENKLLAIDLTPPSSQNTNWRNSLIMDNPNADATAWFSYWVYDAAGTAPEVNAAYARRRTTLAAYTTAVDSSRFLRINLITGEITASSNY